MRRSVSSILLALTCALAPLLTTGCKGEERVDVKGRVTYNGAPLAKPGGQIVFVGPKGTQVVSPIGLDGTYLAPNVPAGPNQVAVYYPNPASAVGGKKPTRQKKGEPPSTLVAPPPPFLTPYKYASPETSNLSVKVEKGTVFDPDLVGPKIR